MTPRTCIFRTAFLLISAFLPLCTAVAQQTPPQAPAAATPAVPTVSQPPAESPAPVPVTREDWTSLKLDPASFSLLDPAAGGEVGTDKFYRELVQLQWRFGDPVEVFIVRPKGVKNPPVVLYLYGHSENLDRFKDDSYCERITSGGYAAVGFEPALGIDRLRSGRPLREWFISELQESLGSSVHDVQQVLNYLETRKDIDVNHAGIFGQGSSGAIAILAAAVDPRLQAVDTLNPWGDWPDLLAKSVNIPQAERSAYLKPEFLEKVKMLEPVDWLPNLKASNVRLQFVSGNPNLPEEATKKMEAAAHDTATTRFTLIRYKDTNDLMQQTAGGKLFDWIKVHLRTTGGDGQTQAVAQPDAMPDAAAASGKSDAKR